MKVDIRDAAAWGRLDQALTRLAEGKKKAGGGSSSSSSSAGQPPPHAASAPMLGGMEALDEEEAEGEGLGFEAPGSPDSSASGSAAAAGDSQEAEGQDRAGGKGRRGVLSGLRLYSARKLRQLAENTAQHISR